MDTSQMNRSTPSMISRSGLPILPCNQQTIGDLPDLLLDPTRAFELNPVTCLSVAQVLAPFVSPAVMDFHGVTQVA